MELFKKNKAKEKTEHRQRQFLIQYGIPIVLLVAILIVIISNFFVISKNDAKENVHEKLIMQTSDLASNLETYMQVVMASSSAVAGIMGDESKCTSKDIVWYAKELNKAQPNCYMVIIADNEGIGYTSDGVKINISDKDYFSVSRSRRVSVTTDDGVLNQAAYVFATPYYQNNISMGNIYAFVKKQSIADFMPSKEYSYAFCDSKGNLISSFGNETKLLANGEYLVNVRKATLFDTNYNRVSMRLGKQSKYVYSVGIENEEKTVTSVPLGISDWQLLLIQEKDYVDKLVSDEWSNIRSMTGALGLIAVVFVVVIVVIVVINKIRSDQESQELANKADTDLLTELNNKIATERKITEYITAHPDSQCLFFLFDIDNFKKINDTLGHAFGDEVLRSLGLQLRNEFRVTDIIGRTGGDEFILFLKDLNSDEVLAKEAKRLENLFHQFKAGEYVKYSATASIGATVFPRDAKDYQGLYKSADKALYEAKRRGKNCLVFYNKDLQEVDTEKKKETPIESDMR